MVQLSRAALSVAHTHTHTHTTMRVVRHTRHFYCPLLLCGMCPAGVAKRDVEYWEVNEAFSVVDLANRQLLGLDPQRFAGLGACRQPACLSSQSVHVSAKRSAVQTLPGANASWRGAAGHATCFC
jgi:hypothetical protein